MSLSNTYQPNAPAARLGQGSAITNREDLSNELQILAPEQTPVLSLCSKGTTKATYYEWGLDKLRSPSTTGQSEGQDVQSFTNQFSALARIGNYIQIQRDDWAVSTLQEAVESAAPVNIVKAKAKAILQLKRDIEATICSDNDRTIENGGGVPYGMRGLGDWLDSAGPADVPADYRTPAASILTAAPTESTFNDLIRSIFTKNGMVNKLTGVFAPALRNTISNFTRTDNNTGETVYHVNQNAESKKVTLAVSVYDSDFGLVNIMNANPDCMPNANRGYMLNPDYIGYNTLKPMYGVQLENQGGGERGFVESIGTLVCKHPQAHGKIAY